MAKSKPVLVPPPEALPDSESVPFVKKYKTSLCKKWSFTKAESLWQMSDLAVFLWALERPQDALAIAHTVALEVPSPPELKGGRFNYSIWSPASRQHSLIVQLGATTCKEQAERSRAAIIREPGFARDNPPFLAQQVTEAREALQAATGVESQKWECTNLSRGISTMTLFLELAQGGDSLFSPYGKEAKALIAQLLPKLQSRLMDKK